MKGIRERERMKAIERYLGIAYKNKLRTEARERERGNACLHNNERERFQDIAKTFEKRGGDARASFVQIFKKG